MWTNRFLSQKLKTKELQLDALDVILIETNNIFEKSDFRGRLLYRPKGQFVK